LSDNEVIELTVVVRQTVAVVVVAKQVEALTVAAVREVERSLPL